MSLRNAKRTANQEKLIKKNEERLIFAFQESLRLVHCKIPRFQECDMQSPESYEQ